MVTLKRKLKDNQKPVEGREKILQKAQEREIWYTHLYVGIHHCHFSYLQEAAPISLSAVMEQKRSLPGLPLRATVMLMAA